MYAAVDHGDNFRISDIGVCSWFWEKSHASVCRLSIPFGKQIISRVSIHNMRYNQTDDIIDAAVGYQVILISISVWRKLS